MEPAIEVTELSFSYKDGTRALDRCSVTVERGTKVAILGPNGSGKSTLLLHFNGIHLVQQGTVRVLGKTVNQHNEQWLRSKVGLVFQDPDDQIFSGTVWEDVAFGPVNQGLRGEELEARVRQALRFVNMEQYGHKVPYHLSYGQKKRVAIAGVLAMDPDIIVLDEPVAFLDPAGKRALFELLNRLNRQGKTIVTATHDVDLAARWADKVIILCRGRVLTQGEPALLTDKTIVQEAELELPTVTEIFAPFPDLCQPKTPVTVEEARSIIKQLL
ncbi:ATP-binding cassette domain-containing protein [Desulforamulus putei]|uniref:ATP-binding cassette domain-containing protein n=1 Tax=Desulforamulus putei TaxID=74701 RepID=UPI002FDEB2E8